MALHQHAHLSSMYSTAVCLSFTFFSLHQSHILCITGNETNWMCSWLCLDLEARRSCHPFRAMAAPTFSTSDVTIAHLHGSRTVPKEPKGVERWCVMTFQRQGNFCLCCDENLSPNSGWSPNACVLFFFPGLGLKRYSPPTVLRCTICVCCILRCLTCSALLWKKKYLAGNQTG